MFDSINLKYQAAKAKALAFYNGLSDLLKVLFWVVAVPLLGIFAVAAWAIFNALAYVIVMGLFVLAVIFLVYYLYKDYKESDKDK